MAGYRGQAPYITFLFFRLVTPIVLLLSARFYMFFVISHMDKPMPVKLGMCVAAAYLGMQAADAVPEEHDQQAPAVDQARLSRRARPAADLRRIRHVDRSRVPQGQRRRSARQSIALAEEFTLTTAELSYLPDRKVAYENLAKRTGLEGVKSVCLALHAGRALRHAARPDAARDGAGKPRHAHDRRPRRRPPRCRRS